MPLRAGRPLARPARSCFCLAVTYHGRKAPPQAPGAHRGYRLPGAVFTLPPRTGQEI